MQNLTCFHNKKNVLLKVLAFVGEVMKCHVNFPNKFDKNLVSERKKYISGHMTHVM